VSSRGHRVILRVRDVRDILVSSYFHARYRSDSFRGSLSAFVRHAYTGIEKGRVGIDVTR
jgi:hypothetical protein